MTRPMSGFTWRTSLQIFVAVWLIAGCGGGGGGGTADSGPPAQTIADTAAQFWAAGAGSRWTYQLVDSRPGANPLPVLKTVEDLGEETVAGRKVHRFEHSRSLFDATTETEYRYFDGREIRNLIPPAADLGTALPPEDYAEVPAPLREGETTTVVNRSESIDVNGDFSPDQLRVEVRTTLASVATLTVPAGDFRGLLRARQDLTATVTLGGSSQSASAGAVLTTWYAPGVGVVRRVYEDSTLPAPNNTVTEELAGVVVGSIRAGLVPANVGLDAIGAGNNSGTPDSIDFAIAGSGQFMTVAASQAGTVEGAIHDANGSLVWRGTVLSTNPPYRLAAAAVAFDGTDFRAVASRTIPYNSPTEYALVGQRITLTGGLRDGTAGVVLDNGVADASQTLAGLRVAARQGNLLVSWGRYDTTYVPLAPGLVTQRGYVIEGRLFNAQQLPVAPRFELGSGLPAAVAARDDQYIVINRGQDEAVTTLNSWAIGVGGVPVSLSPQTVSRTPWSKTSSRLQMAGGELWLSYSEWSGAVPMSAASVIVARLGRDGALLDGTPDAPGRVLLSNDTARGNYMLALGASRSLLAWSEGWNTVRATLFDNGALTGTSQLPSTFAAIAPDAPGGTGGPSRSIVMAGDTGQALLVGWLDNEQSAATASDRVMFTLFFPRYVAR